MERAYDYNGAPNSLIAAINEAALGAVNRVFKMLALRKVKVQLDNGAFMPERAHDTDAGADIRTPEGFRLAAHGSEIVATGVHVQLPPNTVGMLKSKSGLNIKHGIISEGVIDEGFSGEIMVKLYNLTDEPYIFRRGDKITQIVVTPVYYPEFEEVEAVEGGERGESGYGSTGR